MHCVTESTLCSDGAGNYGPGVDADANIQCLAGKIAARHCPEVAAIAVGRVEDSTLSVVVEEGGVYTVEPSGTVVSVTVPVIVLPIMKLDERKSSALASSKISILMLLLPEVNWSGFTLSVYAPFVSALNSFELNP